MIKSPQHPFRIILFSIWIIVFLACLIILSFPALDALDLRIPLKARIKEAGAYTFSIPDPYGLLDPETLRIIDNGQRLARVYSGDPRYMQTGTFFIQEDKNDPVSGIVFSTTEADHDGSVLQGKITFKVFSANNIGKLTLLLASGLVLAFLYYFSNMPFGADGQKYPRILQRLSRPFKFVIIQKEDSFTLFSKTPFLFSFSAVLSAAIGLVFSEWLFLTTKSSFMDGLKSLERLHILLIAVSVVSLFCLIIFFVFYLLGAIIFPHAKTFGVYLTQIPFALTSTTLFLILADNFFQTILRTGIAASQTLVRFLIAIAVFLLFLHLLNQAVVGITTIHWGDSQKIWLGSVGGIFLICSVVTIVGLVGRTAPVKDFSPGDSAKGKPNIILIGSDGLNADNLSLYGYSKDTTPFLRELAINSLVGENNYTNSSHSLGSETSLLTGKLPFTTGVVLSPNILTGADKYNNLPGILSNAGYYSISLAIPYYVDAEVLDFQDAFDQVNCSPSDTNFLLKGFSQKLQNESYFLNQFRKRIAYRAAHLLFLSDMPNFTSFLDDAGSFIRTDEERMQCLAGSLETAMKAGKPLFAHIHQMGTHGPLFDSPYTAFSGNQQQTDLWMTPYYDDAILNFDAQISSLVSMLKSHGVYDNTILIIYTDHGSQYSSITRTPLLIHFPQGKFSGVLTSNTQNLDIAPTILDYLHFEIPGWMEGTSLLEPLDENRILISVDPVEPVLQEGYWTIPADSMNFPYKQFRTIHAISCQKIISVDLQLKNISDSASINPIQPCSSSNKYSDTEVLETLDQQIIRRGYPSFQETGILIK